MKHRLLLIICMCSFLTAILIFALQKRWLIIRSPLSTQQGSLTLYPTITKKKVALHYWDKSLWKKEITEILWSDSTSLSLEYILNNWLTLLDEEHILEKKVTIQSAMVNQSGCAYISFDRMPFSKDNSTYSKWMFIEGLLKTVRENGIKIQALQFLVAHQPLEDIHLDFCNPWPLRGFME